jgi:hypothetical protein
VLRAWSKFERFDGLLFEVFFEIVMDWHHGTPLRNLW